MANEISGFTQTKLSRAIRGASKAGLRTSRAIVYADDSIELIFEEEDAPVEHMTEAELIAGLEALNPPSETERG